MQDRITRARLAGDPPDVLISPRVGKIGWFDFHRADETIAHGARAAERNIRIDPGSDRNPVADLQQYAGHRSKPEHVAVSEPVMTCRGAV